jgi:hypothetical protein
MKHSRFTDEQIIGTLKEQEKGLRTADVRRKHGIPKAHSRPRTPRTFLATKAELIHFLRCKRSPLFEALDRKHKFMATPFLGMVLP